MHKLDGAGQRGIKEQNTRNFRVDLIQCSQSIVCSLRIAHKGNKKNYKKFWWLNDLKQLDWFSWEASISSENNSEPLEFDQVKAVTPMLAGFNWHKRYNKRRMRNKKLSSQFESMQSSIVCSLRWPPVENHKKKFCWLIDIYHMTDGAGKKRNHMTKKNMKLWSQPNSKNTCRLLIAQKLHQKKAI